MSGSKLAPLRPDELESLPDRCRGCLYWELGEGRPPEDVEAPSTADRTPDNRRIRKQAWATARALETGPPGVVVRDGRRTVGYALFAPATSFAHHPLRPVPSSDALLLATVWLEPVARAGGIGRQVVQAAVKQALQLDLAAVEAFGDRRSREQDCVLPVTWLLHEGFEVTAEHPRYPLLRIDARRAVRWAESLEHAVEGLLGRVARPVSVPGQARSSVDGS